MAYSWIICSPDMGPFLGQPGDFDPFDIEAAMRVNPSYRLANCSDVTIHAGEILYYPTGWWHATKVLDDYSIGVAGRTVTAHNYKKVYQSLKNSCQNPRSPDPSTTFAGASPNLSTENCKAVKKCYKAWKRKWRRKKKRVPATGTESANDPHDLL